MPCFDNFTIDTVDGTATAPAPSGWAPVYHVR